MEVKLNNEKLMYLKNRKQLFGVYATVLYRVQFQYKTVRGNLKEKIKYIVSFFNSFTAVERYLFGDRQRSILLKYIDEYNRKYPYRKMLDVEILDVNTCYRETNCQNSLKVINNDLVMNLNLGNINFEDVLIEEYSIIEAISEYRDYRVEKRGTKIAYAVGPTYYFDELDNLDEKLKNPKEGRTEKNVSDYISYSAMFQGVSSSDPMRAFIGEIKVKEISKVQIYSKNQ